MVVWAFLKFGVSSNKYYVGHSHLMVEFRDLGWHRVDIL